MVLRRVIYGALFFNSLVLAASYDSLMPVVDIRNPHLLFIRSKDQNRYSLTSEFIAHIARAFHAQTFVETGTYLGDSVARAIEYFQKVHSVELSNELYTKAQERFKNNRNIVLHLGDSSEVLPMVIEEIDDKAVFFLDAHYSRGITVRGKLENPIVQEIEHIKNSGLKDVIFIIDDTRLYYPPLHGCACEEGGYPALQKLVDQIGNSYACRVVLLHDALIVYSAHEPITVSPVARACTISRLYDDQNFTEHEVIKAELVIAQAQGKERESIINLYEQFTKGSRESGASRHHPLWYGLILMAAHEYEKAYEKFQEAYERGLIHWRVQLYKMYASMRIPLPL